MANWARLQEQLTGLPVVKRARNSIHFDKGNGEIVANFSGKPCHYQDTDGLWKPIDTKLLLLPDGFYGSPHSDVKIHKDGRVKVGGYQQKSALVDAKEGVVDGDKIVREFKFGTQYLYMKEDGFRQETVITRPPTTAETKYLIASESGELPSKYKRSDITAVDADGEVHEFVNLGQFKKWLDAAAYPVTIDPDFAGGSADGWITSYFVNNWAASRTDGKSINTTNTLLVIRQRYAAPYYGKYRSYLLFDTSSIGSSSTVTQVNLKTYVTQAASTPVYIIKQDWSSQNPLSTDNMDTAFSNTITSDKDSASLDLSTTGAKTSGNLSTTWVSKTGTTYYALILDTDYDNTESTDQYYIEIASQAHATESYRPVLSVTYSSSGVPKHFLHYARLRSN